MIRALQWIFFAAMLVTGLGCGRSQPVTFAQWVAPELPQVRRVVIVPFQTPDSSDKAQIVPKKLGAALRSHGQFEVMHLKMADIPQLSSEGAWDSNRIEPEILRALSSQYNCDAVLIGRIDRWHPYDPVAIGLQVHLIEVSTGSVVWSVGGDFNSRNQNVQDAIEGWWDATGGSAQASVSGWRITLSSPTIFSDWLATTIVSAIPSPDESHTSKQIAKKNSVDKPHR